MLNPARIKSQHIKSQAQIFLKHFNMLISASKNSKADEQSLAHVRYIDPSCHIFKTIQKQLHTCYLTESQQHLYVPLNCFSAAQFQPPKNPNKAHKENVCAYTHKKTQMKNTPQTKQNTQPKPTHLFCRLVYYFLKEFHFNNTFKHMPCDW